jgi:signal peptidase II
LLLEEVLNRVLKNYLILFLVAGAIVALDQYTKVLVQNNLGINEIWSPWPWLTPYARVVHLSNTGVAFGMLQGMGTVFAVLAVIISGAIIYYYPRVSGEDWTLRVAMMLQLGGALGNLVDRVTRGYVTDFISVGNFAVFNVADSSITVGVCVLILGVWLQERRKKKMEGVPTALPEITEPEHKDGMDN